MRIRLFFLRTFILLFTFTAVTGASQNYCAKTKVASLERELNIAARPITPGSQISHEMKYDMKFIHLNVNVERNTKYISGEMKMVSTVTVAAMDTFMCLLHQNFSIDSVKVNNVLYGSFRQDSMIKAGLPSALINGATFTAQVFYKGTAPSGGSAIGSGFSTGTSGSWGNQATWSLSQSFVAYHWWPCKQVLTDKIDSSWVYITTDSLNMAGSNGMLQNVVIVGNKKRFEWKSRKPIDYYLISVAVAKYKEYRLYAKPQYLGGDSILIQNFIYDNAINNPAWINGQKVTLNKMPQVLKFLCDMYGMYPFYKEKYGHCMAPLSGGMEHQTMTTLGFFDYYVDAHELGHQWFGDNVTCKRWQDIWLNEGFAAYTEHLVAQYLDPINFATNLNSTHVNVMSQPGGSIFLYGSDTLNTNRIFSSRLTYDKGGAVVHSLRFLTNNDSVWFNTLRGYQNTYKNSTASIPEFQNYYQAQTGINPTVFFNQWIYGQGYPTFTVKFHSRNNNFYLQSTESVSMPTVTPLFITPLEYAVSRIGKADTVIRLQHNLAIENYTIPMTGTVTGVTCDPFNWIINKSTVSRDTMLGYVPPPPVDPNPAGIAEVSASYAQITVGPNPVKQQLYITNPAHSVCFVRLCDLNGKILFEKTVSSDYALPMDDYPEGYYLLQIRDEKGMIRANKQVIKR